MIAFEQLAEQLTEWKAPLDFIEGCHQGADDQIRHERILCDFATVYSADTYKVQNSDVLQSEDMLPLALHVATEGCVSEGWSALLASRQTQSTEPEHIRDAYEEIAADKIAHTQLCWDIHHWFIGKLSGEKQKLVFQAQENAIALLPLFAREQIRNIPAEFDTPVSDQTSSLAETSGIFLRTAA